MLIPSDIRTFKARAAHYSGPRGPWLEHLIEDEGLDLGGALATLKPWEFIEYSEDPYGHMATLLKRNKEVHFAAYRKFRRRGFINNTRLASFLQPILDAEVFLVTKVAPGEDRRFIQHLGFQPLGVTIDGVQTFILNELKYPEAKRCRQVR